MKAFFSKSLNPKYFARGILFFILCTVIGLYLSFLRSDTENIGIVLRSMNSKFLLLAVLCMFCDWLSGGARLYIFVQKMAPSVTFLHGLRANLGKPMCWRNHAISNWGPRASLYFQSSRRTVLRDRDHQHYLFH